MPYKPTPARAAALSDDLRDWLRLRRESPAEQLSALVYTLVALVGKQAPTVEQAHAMIDHWADGMKAQISAFGVDREHP
jgi:hypothetical protein